MKHEKGNSELLMEDREYQATPLATERSFGVVFCAVFALFAAYGWWQNWGTVTVSLLVIFSLLMLFLGYFAPNTLRIPNRLWAKLGLLLAIVITPIIMGLVFLLAVTPSGLFMRMFGQDPMKRKFDTQANSYWIKRDKQPGSMRQQY